MSDSTWCLGFEWVLRKLSNLSTIKLSRFWCQLVIGKKTYTRQVWAFCITHGFNYYYSKHNCMFPSIQWLKIPIGCLVVWFKNYVLKIVYWNINYTVEIRYRVAYRKSSDDIPEMVFWLFWFHMSASVVRCPWAAILISSLVHEMFSFLRFTSYQLSSYHPETNKNRRQSKLNGWIF